MTAHPIDTEALRRLADAATTGPWEAWQGKAWGEAHSELSIQPVQESWDSDPAHACCEPLEPADAEFIAAARTAVPALLDAIAAAEHRATRAEAQSAIRGRAVAIYQQRAREAEARIKAVQDLIDQADTAGDWAITCSRLQWAIDGTTPTIERQEAR